MTQVLLKNKQKCVNDIPALKCDIAMVFQNYALYPHMSAYENMAFGLKRKKTPKPIIKKSGFSFTYQGR